VTPTGWSVTRLPFPPGDGPGPFQPVAISCSSATRCLGGGSYPAGSPESSQAAVLNWSGARWNASQALLPAGALSSSWSSVASMACPTADRCFAGGWYGSDAGNEGLLLVKDGPQWSAMQAPAPANASSNPSEQVTGMSCLSARWCSAVGAYSDDVDNQYELLLRWSAGRWTASEAPVPPDYGGNGSLMAVSCPSTTMCVAGGYYYDKAGGSRPILLTWQGRDRVLTSVPLPPGAPVGAQAGIRGVSCASVTSCVAVGGYNDAAGHEQGLLLTLSGGTWTAAEAPLPVHVAGDPQAAVFSVSCPVASSCTAGGTYQTGATSHGLLLTWSGVTNTWTPANAPASAYAVYGMSCPTVTRCVAVSGSTSNTNGLALTGP